MFPKICSMRLCRKRRVSIEDMEIMPVRISHDAANPVCYTVQSESKKIGVAIDMGCFSNEIVDHFERLRFPAFRGKP